MKYSIWRDEKTQQGYSFLHVDLYRDKDLDQTSPAPVLSFSWQGDREITGWYGFKASTEGQCNLLSVSERLAQASRVMRKLSEDGAVPDQDEPAKLVAALEAMGARRVVRDARLQEWVALDKAAPADERRFMSWADDQCGVSVSAANPDHAAKLILRQLIKRSAAGPEGPDSEHYQSILERWLAQCKPCRESTYDKAPDVRPLEEILKPLREPVCRGNATPTATPEQLAHLKHDPVSGPPTPVVESCETKI